MGTEGYVRGVTAWPVSLQSPAFASGAQRTWTRATCWRHILTESGSFVLDSPCLVKSIAQRRCGSRCEAHRTATYLSVIVKMRSRQKKELAGDGIAGGLFEPSNQRLCVKLRP